MSTQIEDDRDFREVPHDDRWVMERHRETVAEVRNHVQEIMCVVEEVALKMAQAGYLNCEVERSEFDLKTRQWRMIHDHYLTNTQAAARLASIVKETVMDWLSDEADFSFKEVG